MSIMREFNLDEKKWLFSKKPICHITQKTNDTITVESENKIQFSTTLSELHDKGVDIDDNTIQFTEESYRNWFLEPEKVKINKSFNELFNKNVDLIFQNRSLVLEKDEYYLLRPKLLTSGGSVIGGFSYSLGELFESMNSGNHFYFKEFGGHKEMYLVSTIGSPLTGIHSYVFWSEDEKRIIDSFTINRMESLPKPWAGESYAKMWRLLKSKIKLPEIDFEDLALENLLIEINSNRSKHINHIKPKN